MVDTRQVDRDSLFLLADMYVGGSERPERVKVRNLSPGGMMAEGAIEVERGTSVTVELRNVGPVCGTVAWVQGRRFGVAFEREIDAKLVRVPVSQGDNGDRSGYTQLQKYIAPKLPQSEVSKLRKV